ncbi:MULTISPECIES: gamma-glutamyl-gamma-aminobutyrate hydrolase family protein [unclassified Pseudomonas]|uniref:gamma-glutamyl-gamma-aminobutyrate hydrolase family protein n=1 Tax=unclassified Pseudomonas TaxID=196821 RepID=UPI001D08E55F|nr:MULTISPECIES: gamma-glutamyl-gamma-aminobutyrate hydrolase family protein [unclassified Pseudomonas]
MSRLPLIGVTDCSLQSGLHAYHISGDTSVRSTARKACNVPAISLPMADRAAASDIPDVCEGILFNGSTFNIDLFPAPGLHRVRRRARDSAHPECAQEMQHQRKGQVSSSFIVYARCQA